ncbi:putative DNA-binding protein YwzG [Capsulimonas corticalis]|uniref:DNA-binding protein YwzG n=1 Tax=Capsulimonas corticalis TaxID=2219043 RepID=A0A402D261_9BACT|nr:helix-turn-helix transcriptional regulator [Capsulimonas corticalis]BDI30179.1 putative DNA-binding protein YwzG [Capsulimonas corticalis]
MGNERELLKGNTPTLILAVLEEMPMHGYAIAQAIEKRSGDILKFKYGTLYPALYSLESAGLIAGQWEHLESERPRKTYSITEAGQAELSKRTAAWSLFSMAVNNIIEGVKREQPA